MPVNQVAEGDLRKALRPYRYAPDAFEAGIRQRLASADLQPAPDPFVGVAPLLRSAAAFLPLGLLLGCKTSSTATRESSAGRGHLLLGYLAFPAISLFLLLGAAIFSGLRIRSLKGENNRELDDLEARNEAIRQWWSDNKRAAQAVFVLSLTLALIGKAWLLFLLYVMSLGILLYVVSAFARRGIGDRAFVARACASGLMFLGQLALFAGVGIQDIHFLDQRLVAAVFLAGALALLPFSLPTHEAASRRGAASGRGMIAVQALLVVPLIAWLASSILLPATPARIRNYVESFDHAKYSTVSWRRWEIVMDWVRRSTPNLDLSKPRRLLAREIANDENPYVLGSALRTGLMHSDQIALLKTYPARLQSLIAEPLPGMTARSIASLEQTDWVIRAAVLRNDLSPEERDRLRQRLRITVDEQWDRQYVGLGDVLRLTQLLEMLGQPPEIDLNRAKVHHLLRRFHSLHAGGFQLAGGFRRYLPSAIKSSESLPGDLEPTAEAIELMEIYGIPHGLDLNWVRSFLRPSGFRLGDDQWVAAVTLDRLNHLPDAPQPTWIDLLYHERPLLAAMVLVGLCLYATVCSPRPRDATAPVAV